MTRTLILTIACLVSIPFSGHSQEITIDSGFGTAGLARFDLKYAFPELVAARLQPDGKILALSFHKRNNTTYSGDSMSLVRFMPDGAFDNSFGVEGVSLFNWGGGDIPTDFQLQPDGKIIVAGFSKVLDVAIIARYNADGSTDPSFGAGGKTSLELFRLIAKINIQPDGKIAIVALKDPDIFSPYRMIRAKLLPDGTIDESFGESGYFYTPDQNYYPARNVNWDQNGRLITGENTSQGVVFKRFDLDGNQDFSFGNNGAIIVPLFGLHSFFIQDDGKILILGGINSSQLFRVLSDGTFDATFGNGGEMDWSEFMFFFNMEELKQLIIQPDGRILLMDSQSTIVRLLPDGSFDTSLGGSGGITVAEDLYYYKPCLLLHRPNGNIIAFGTNQTLIVNEYLPNGNPDTTFGIMGEVNTLIRETFSNDYFGTMAVQSDGKIVFSSSATYTSGVIVYYPYYTIINFTYSTHVIMRLNVDGSLDTTFANAGKFEAIDPLMTVSTIAIQPDGKILVIGEDVNPHIERVYILRLDTQGHIDSTFGQGGFTYPYFDRLTHSDQRIAFQADGKFVITGSRLVFSNPIDLDYAVLARFDSNGLPDPGFGTNGIIQINQSSPGYYNTFSNMVLIQPDGKLLRVGVLFGNENNLVLARYNAEGGTLDATFGTNGQIIYPITSSGGNGLYASRLLLQPDGKIVISGHKGEYLGICRFNADGSPDLTFGTNGLLTTSIKSYGQHELKLEESGKLIIVLNQYNEETLLYELAFVRINANGVMDDSYGEEGVMTTIPPGSVTMAKFLQGGDIFIGLNIYPGDLGLVKYKSNLSVGIANTQSMHPELLVYPNPISHASTVRFELPAAASLSVELYDMSGRNVKTIAGLQRYDTGTHQVALDMGQLPRGNYVLVLNSAKWIIAERIVY